MADFTAQASKIAADIVRTWANWSDDTRAAEEASNNALRDACKEAKALDIHQVEGVLASPLNYFVRAHLDDENPEDLTYGEMIESIEISLGLVGEG